jgi:hypothetical protein
MTNRFILSLVFVSSFIGIADADQKTIICSMPDSITAEKAIDTLSDWNKIYDFYRQYARCDSGSISEGLSFVISRLLSAEHASLDNLSVIAGRDKQFELFVLGHIDQTISTTDVPKIVNNVTNHCPEPAKRICRLIECKLLIESETAGSGKYSNKCR